MPGSRDPGVTIVNPTEISIMYGYVTWRMTTEIYVMYGSEGVKSNTKLIYLVHQNKIVVGLSYYYSFLFY